MFNRISSTVGCVVWSCPILYPNGTLAGFAKATKTCPAAKWYWRPLNSKRSLPVLKWTSESEYFLSFNFFLQNLYTMYSSPRAITLPLAAHAQRGVIIANLLMILPCNCEVTSGRFSCHNSEPHQPSSLEEV